MLVFTSADEALSRNFRYFCDANSLRPNSGHRAVPTAKSLFRLRAGNVHIPLLQRVSRVDGDHPAVTEYHVIRLSFDNIEEDAGLLRPVHVDVHVRNIPDLPLVG